MIAPERGDLMTTRHNGSKRSGMSLMEVIVALAVFLSALIVLGRLVVLGGEQAREVQELARATAAVPIEAGGSCRRRRAAAVATRRAV